MMPRWISSGRWMTLSAFDLGEGKLSCFAAYRFLYERLLGPAVRPWLPEFAFLPEQRRSPICIRRCARAC